MKTIELYTAGISINQHSGVSGYGVLIIDNGQKIQLSQSFQQSTNSRMQITACIEGLKTLKEPCIVNIYLTSEYIANSVNYDWISKWKKEGWENSAGDKIQNVDLWIQLQHLLARHNVKFLWVRKNMKNSYIEECNIIAKRAINVKEPVIDSGYEKNQSKKNQDIINIKSTKNMKTTTIYMILIKTVGSMMLSRAKTALYGVEMVGESNI